MQTAPHFHDWLESKLRGAPRGTLSVVSRAIGCNPSYLGLTRQRKQFPRPQQMRKLGNHFGVPTDWVAEWNAEAVRHWGDNADIQMSLAGLRKAEQLPCLDCDKTIYKSDWRQGQRRCPECQRKRGRGAGQRRSPRNPLGQFLLARMKQLGMKGHQLSLRIGRNGDWFSNGCRHATWRPARADLEAVAHILDDDVDNLIRIAGGTLEEVQHIQGKRVQILRLATQIDRAKGDGRSECYQAVRPLVQSETGAQILDRIRDTLLSEQRARNPEGLRTIAMKKRGRKRPPEVGARIAQAKRRAWQKLTPQERQARSAHLHTPSSRIKAVIAREISRWGPQHVTANVAQYAQRAAVRWQLPVSATRAIIREALGGFGRPSQYDHPKICDTRRTGATWTVIGGESARVAHRQWHRLHGVVSCSPR